MYKYVDATLCELDLGEFNIMMGNLNICLPCAAVLLTGC